MSESYVIGVDFGTSSIKGALYDASMRRVAFAHEKYPLFHKDGGVVEQNPEDWYKKLCVVVRSLTKEVEASAVAAISSSTQGGTLVCLDSEGRPAGAAISWMDNRPMDIDEVLDGTMTGTDLWRLTGWRPAGTLVLGKLRWLALRDPEFFRTVAMAAECNSYINYRLCGEVVIDETNAAITQLYDLGAGDWSTDLLGLAGVSREQVPRIVKSGAPAGTLTAQAAEDLGLSQDVVVVSGGHDQYCAALGAGVFERGSCLLSCGTAWVILSVMDALPRAALTAEKIPEFAIGPHVLPGLYGVLSSMPRAGAVHKWFIDTWVPKELDEETTRKAAELPPGAEGLLAEICPDGTLTFQHIGLQHRPEHFLRAIMEAVAYRLGRTIESWRRSGVDVERLVMVGGAARDNHWAGIIAGVTGLAVSIPAETELACQGAAMLARMGCEAGGAEAYAKEASAGAVAGQADSTSIAPRLTEAYLSVGESRGSPCPDRSG